MKNLTNVGRLPISSYDDLDLLAKKLLQVISSLDGAGIDFTTKAIALQDEDNNFASLERHILHPTKHEQLFNDSTRECSITQVIEFRRGLLRGLLSPEGVWIATPIYREIILDYRNETVFRLYPTIKSGETPTVFLLTLKNQKISGPYGSISQFAVNTWFDKSLWLEPHNPHQQSHAWLPTDLAVATTLDGKTVFVDDLGGIHDFKSLEVVNKIIRIEKCLPGRP
jgi:hypothetical protein